MEKCDRKMEVMIKEKMEKCMSEMEQKDPINSGFIQKIQAAEVCGGDQPERHKNYFANNRTAGYCQLVIAPKIEKVGQKFGNLLKKE